MIWVIISGRRGCRMPILLAGLLLLSLLPVGSVLAASRLSVKVNLANVRAAPSKKAEILWQVARYHPFVVVSRQGDWYKCQDFEGDTGWLSQKVLSQASTVITIKDNCNVRSGPGTRNRILFVVDREVPLKVIKRQGRWIKIRHEDGDQGWIHSSLVW